MKLKNFKMTKKLYFYLLTIMLFSTFISCSKDNGTGSLIEDKLETMSGKEILRELLIKNDNDVNQLARIFDCSPSSLRRILAGKETIATPNAIIEFKNILHQVLITKKKTLDELDPINRENWIYQTKFFIQNHYVWGIVILFIGLIIALIKNELIGAFIILLDIIILLIYLLLISIIWFKGDPVIIDSHKNSADTIWEQPIIR